MPACCRTLGRCLAAVLLLAATAALAATVAAVQAAEPPRVSDARVASYSPPADISFRTVAVMSEGVRLNAEIFAARVQAGQKLPTVIQANGWGGVAAIFRPDAVALARAGYVVINFDYRGWGLSDGRLVLVGSPQATDDHLSAPVTELRGYVDPLEQVTDWANVIAWAVGDPAVDPARIGLRGTSYSGGHVVYVAAQDRRVKAIVSQVAGFNSDWVMAPGAMRAATYQEATRRARGEIGYPAPGAGGPGGLAGAPIRDKLARYAPLAEAPKLDHCAALFIVAERDELVRNDISAHRAFDLIPDPRKAYVVIPRITHFYIYGVAREEAVARAVDWFDRYLKPAAP